MEKKFILVPVFLLLLFLLLSSPCDKSLTCRGGLAEALSYPSQWFFILIFLSLLALSLNDQKHKFWLKFTGIFFVIAMFFVLLMPETSQGIMLSPDKEITNWFLLAIYIFISILYFIVQFFKTHKR